MFWGQQQGAMVILWDTLSAVDKEQWLQEMNTSTEPWVLFRSKTGKTNATEPTTADTAVTTARVPGRCFLTLRPERKSTKGSAREELGTTKGRAQRQKRWWYKGRIDACINTTTMECWTNMDESSIRPEDINHIKLEGMRQVNVICAKDSGGKECQGVMPQTREVRTTGYKGGGEHKNKGQEEAHNTRAHKKHRVSQARKNQCQESHTP